MVISAEELGKYVCVVISAEELGKCRGARQICVCGNKCRGARQICVNSLLLHDNVNCRQSHLLYSFIGLNRIGN